MKKIQYTANTTTEPMESSARRKKGPKIDPAGPIIEHMRRSLPASLQFLVMENMSLEQVARWQGGLDRTIYRVLSWWVWHWKAKKAREVAEANGTPLDDYYKRCDPADTTALGRAVATLDDPLFEALVAHCPKAWGHGHDEAMAAVRGARDLYGIDGPGQSVNVPREAGEDEVTDLLAALIGDDDAIGGSDGNRDGTDTDRENPEVG